MAWLAVAEGGSGRRPVRGQHSLPVHALACAVAWLPCFWLLFFRVPRFGPVFHRMAEQGELPKLSGVVLALAEFNIRYAHAPAFSLFLGLLAVDLLAVRRLRCSSRPRAGLWLWFAAVTLAVLGSYVVTVWALLAPVYALEAAVE